MSRPRRRRDRAHLDSLQAGLQTGWFPRRLPHARVALDNVTLAECASVAGDQLLANAARKEAIRLLERTGAPDARQLDDMRIQHAMADNARSDDKLAANFDHLGLDGE